MIRISRIIYAPAVSSILNLEGVQKVEINKSKQGFRQPVIRVHIFLSYGGQSFKTYMGDIRAWAVSNNNTKARTTVDQAIHDGFIKESAYEKICRPIPKKWKELCTKYSQEFFNKYGELAKLTQTG